MNIETLAGITASALTAASMLPQLCKVMSEKKAENISYGMLIVLLCGLGVWVYYGILKNDWIIIIANAFSFLVNVILLIAAGIFKK